MTLVGRDNEIKELNKCLHSDRSHFVAIYGRRRVGKTFLVKTFFKNSFAFYATGLADADKQTQLSNFNLALRKYKKKDTPSVPIATDWLNAFNNLIEVLEQQEPTEKKIIFSMNCRGWTRAIQVF